MLPSWIGKKNKYDAAWVAILFSAAITAFLITQSYLFLVSCIVLASLIQYVPSILAVIKFKHINEFPNHGFKLTGGYTITILALIISCYMVTNFTWKTIFLGLVVGVLAAIAYFFIDKDKAVEHKHQLYLKKCERNNKKYLIDKKERIKIDSFLLFILVYSTVTLLAKLRGLSTSSPLSLEA